MGYDYIRKLKAMMAKAASTPSSEEADSIMQKVHQMMEQHGVSLLGLNTHLSDDPVGITDPGIHYWHSDNWAKALYSAIGRFYGCKTYYLTQGNKTRVIVNGRESCRATFILMAPYLFKSVRRLADHATKEYRYANIGVAKRDIGKALTHRLWALYFASQEAAGPRAQAGHNALVPLDIMDIVERDAFGEIEESRSGKKKEITMTGRILAEQISLAEQLGEIIPKDRLLT